MGYRTYIAEMPKREYNKIKSMNKDDLVKFYDIEIDGEADNDYESWYKGVYEYGKDLYCFGKYTDFEPPKKSMKPFFKNKDLMKRYEGYDFYIVTPEFLEYLIEYYSSLVEKNYNDLLNPLLGEQTDIFTRETPSEFMKSVKTEYKYPKDKHSFDFSKITDEEQTAIFNLIQYTRSNRFEWLNDRPYDLKSGTEITSSWKYEYAVFELVNIYKNFDWKRKVMMFIGW